MADKTNEAKPDEAGVAAAKEQGKKQTIVPEVKVTEDNPEFANKIVDGIMTYNDVKLRIRKS